MILMNQPFSVFIYDFYLPTLEKYAYHRPHYILLGKNESGALRKGALKPGDFETTRDYAERLSFKLDNEIMSLNFGNFVSLSMEGASVRHFSNELVASYILINQYHMTRRIIIRWNFIHIYLIVVFKTPDQLTNI